METGPQALKMCGQDGELDRLMAALLVQLQDLQVPVSPKILP